MATIQTNPVDAFVYSNTKVDDVALRNQILDIVSTYTCMSQYQQMVSFFSNPANIEGIKDAVSVYGLPPKNTASYHTGLLYYGEWHDFCDWQNGVYKFYLASILFVNFPNLQKVQTNCEMIKDLQLSLQTELSNADRKFIADADDPYHSNQIALINERIAYYNGLFSGMTCDVYIQDKLEGKAAAQRATELDLSQKSNLATFKAATSASANTSKLATYVAIGVAGLIGTIVIIKMLKK